MRSAVFGPRVVGLLWETQSLCRALMTQNHCGLDGEPVMQQNLNQTIIHQVPGISKYIRVSNVPLFHEI